MGRPKLTSKQRRERRFTIYVTDDEARRIIRTAVAAGHAVTTDWIRSSVVGMANAVTGGGR